MRDRARGGADAPLLHVPVRLRHPVRRRRRIAEARPAGHPRAGDRRWPAAHARVHGEVRRCSPTPRRGLRAGGRRRPRVPDGPADVDRGRLPWRWWASRCSPTRPTSASSWRSRCRARWCSAPSWPRSCSSAACSSSGPTSGLLPVAALTLIGAAKTGSFILAAVAFVVVERRRQPVRGARDRGHPRPARAPRVAPPSAGVLGRGADRR